MGFTELVLYARNLTIVKISLILVWSMYFKSTLVWFGTSLILLYLPFQWILECGKCRNLLLWQKQSGLHIHGLLTFMVYFNINMNWCKYVNNTQTTESLNLLLLVVRDLESKHFHCFRWNLGMLCLPNHQQCYT